MRQICSTFKEKSKNSKAITKPKTKPATAGRRKFGESLRGD